MKKVLVILLAAALCAVSCKNQPKEAAEVEAVEATEIVDTTVVEEVADSAAVVETIEVVAE